MMLNNQAINFIRITALKMKLEKKWIGKGVYSHPGMYGHPKSKIVKERQGKTDRRRAEGESPPVAPAVVWGCDTQSSSIWGGDQCTHQKLRVL